MEGVAGLPPPDPRAEQFFSPMDLKTIWHLYPLNEQVVRQAIRRDGHVGLLARWEVKQLDQLLLFERQA